MCHKLIYLSEHRQSLVFIVQFLAEAILNNSNCITYVMNVVMCMPIMFCLAFPSTCVFCYISEWILRPHYLCRMEWIPTTVPVQLAGLEHIVRRTPMNVITSLVTILQHAKLSSYLYGNSTVNYLFVNTGPA